MHRIRGHMLPSGISVGTFGCKDFQVRATGRGRPRDAVEIAVRRCRDYSGKRGAVRDRSRTKNRPKTVWDVHGFGYLSSWLVGWIRSSGLVRAGPKRRLGSSFVQLWLVGISPPNSAGMRTLPHNAGETSTAKVDRLERRVGPVSWVPRFALMELILSWATNGIVSPAYVLASEGWAELP